MTEPGAESMGIGKIINDCHIAGLVNGVDSGDFHLEVIKREKELRGMVYSVLDMNKMPVEHPRVGLAAYRNYRFGTQDKVEGFLSDLDMVDL